MTVALKINEELNGIELYFNSKPSAEVRGNLKSSKFRYSNFKNCWYAKQSEETFQVANDLMSGELVEMKPKGKTAKRTTKKETISLWDATQWVDMELTHEQKEQDVKEIAKEVRNHLRKRFPQCKFSITVPYYGKINSSIKSSPFEEDSVYLNAVKEYSNKLINAYNVCYDAGDSYSDIPASYNFYFFKTSVDYDYKQTEVTEEITKNMIEFDSKLIESEKVAEEKREQEYQEYKKQQEVKNAEYNKQKEEEKKQVTDIYNSVEVTELDENGRYFITGSEFAHLNKNNTLDEYIEEVGNGKFSLEDVKITKEVHFNNKEALENFSNMLLTDFDFLNNTGGSFTEDNRINSMTDFHNMHESERKSVKWYLNGVAIYLNNKLQFIVDAQGYSYARYVGLVDNAQIQKTITVSQIVDGEELEELKLQADQLEDISTSVIDELNIMGTWEKENWKEYKESFKRKLSNYNIKLTSSVIQQLDIEGLKVSMYKLLQEVDGIQEQFKDADIKQGDKVTLFYISDWGSIVTSRITLDSVLNTSYAQYDNAVKLTFTPENKRKLHYSHFHSTLLVYNGWHSLKDDVLNHVEESNGMRTTRSKYHSCDNRQYDEILNHFEQQGIKPIVNSYKPTF